MRRSGLALFTALACAARARAGSVVYESELCSSEAANWDTSELSSQISFATGAGDGCVLRMEWLTENRNYAWLYPSAGGASTGWSNVRVTATMRAIGQPLSNGRGSVHLMVRDEVGPDSSCEHNTPRSGFDFNLDFGVHREWTRCL